MDPDPHGSELIWLFGSGSGPVLGMEEEINQNLQINLHFSLSKRLLYPRRYRVGFMTYCLHKVPHLYFSFKNPTFWDVFVWPGSGSAFVWLPGSGSGSALRLKSRSGSSLKTNAYPQHSKCLKSVLICQDGANLVRELGPGGVLPPRRRQADLAREV